MSCKAQLATVAALLLLGGCDTIHDNGSIDPGFGEAARYNAAVQTINPDPPVASADAAVPGDNGAVGAAAAKRYRTDAVKPVVVMSTSNGSSGGGSSSGSSGGTP